VCALVVGVYAYAAYSGFMATPDQQAAEGCYNQLVEAFQAGQLNLKVDVPAGLTQLANPYDPTANAPYRTLKYGLYDLSYYKGKLYLYFGVTPAVLLFWPFVALTGHYLYNGQAVVIFCALGFLGSVGILWGLWRRYFPGVSLWVAAAGALALGLAPGVLMLLPRSNVNEVAISCAYMLTMLSLGAIWRALHEPERTWRWLAVASVAYGLAVGARPTLVFGGIILLAPVVQAWRERRPVWPLLLAATVPVMLIGLGLMLYNARRFDSPFEFGMRSCLTSEPLFAQQFFHVRYLWFNFRVYFLEPLRWDTHFPFVREVIVPPLPAGYARVESPYGIPTSVPLVWLALAVPLVWCDRPGQAASILRRFGMVVALLFGICALTIAFYNNVIGRYEVDFLPALMLLAVGGILGLERALADRPRWRCVTRWGWGLLLGFSVAFNLLASVERCADVYDTAGASMQELGRMPEAMELFQHALRMNPNSAEVHHDVALALEKLGRVPEAVEHLEEAVRINPGFAEAHNNLGNALGGMGKVSESVEHFELALRARPDYAEVHNNLGLALMQLGKVPEAMEQFDQAVRIEPDLARVQNDVARSLATAAPTEGGDPSRAVALAQHTCDVTSNHVAAYLDTLGVAYAAAGRFDDAIATARKAIEMARAAGQTELVKEIEAQLELYRSGRAYSPSTGVTSPSNP
jgi:Flp pilus assembly protein TadD